MLRTWRVHAKPHHIDRTADFLKRNLIAVGWGELPSLSGLSRGQIARLLRKTYPEPRDGYGPSVGQLDYLVNQIQVDDHIVMPATTSDEVYLGTVLSKYRHSAKLRDRDDRTGERGFQHHRPVHWLFGKQPLPIEDLPPELRVALRAHQPIVNVRGNHDSFFGTASAEDDEHSGPGRSKLRFPAVHRSQDEDDAYESVEGERRLVVRRERLREARFRDMKIAEARQKGDGRLRCEVTGCGFDFESVYGEIGAGFIHIHHRRSLAEYVGPRRLNGLMLICPNCHAMIHRGGKCRDPKELKVRRR